MIGPIMGGAPRLRYTADRVAITCDGNSLVYGQGSTGGNNITGQLARLAPLNNAIAIVNTGISGQRTYQMTSAAADVDAAYVPGKTNILFAWEGLNDMLGNGTTPQQAYNNMAAYVSAQKAKFPWRVIVMNCIPIYNGDSITQTQIDTENSKLTQYNALLAANWKAMGAEALLDLQQTGSVFHLPDFSRATLKTISAYYSLEADSQGSVSKQVHLNNAGYGKVAQMMANVLRLMRK